MLWSKQYYFFDVGKWLRSMASIRERAQRRCETATIFCAQRARHLDARQVSTVRRWDLAFQTIALGVVDVDFAKQQLDLLPGFYLHPTGQIPPMNGISATQSAGARLGNDLPVPDGTGDGRSDQAFLLRLPKLR
jgi:hypothetical protein